MPTSDLAHFSHQSVTGLAMEVISYEIHLLRHNHSEAVLVGLMPMRWLPWPSVEPLVSEREETPLRAEEKQPGTHYEDPLAVDVFDCSDPVEGEADRLLV